MAAAIAAVQLYLEEEQPLTPPDSPRLNAWRMAARSAGASPTLSPSWTGRG